MTAEFKPLSEKSNPSQKHAGQALGAPVNRSRRRLVNGVASGAGVLLSVHAKTALGGTGVCQSPSAMMSGNASHPHGPTNCMGGRSPGFWKVTQHFIYWKVAYPTFTNTVTCGMKGLTLANISAEGQSVNKIFPGAIATLDPNNVDWGFWAVLAYPNSFPNGMLIRELCNAYLNALQWGDNGGGFPVTSQQVKDMWNQLQNPGWYCPSGMSCAPANGWGAADIEKYFQNMYDINEAPVNNTCSK